MLRRNLVANVLGQGWAALMGIIFIPVYIGYLGVEAYGLIGLYSVMQATLVLLDMGMTPTLSREMARFTGGEHTPQSIRDLLRSIEVVVFAVAIVIGLLVWSRAEWIATSWLKVGAMPVSEVAYAMSMIAIVLATRFCEGIYRGAVLSLQQQVWYNAAYALLSTARFAGVILVLHFVSPTVGAFFLWQAFISVLTLLVFALKLYSWLPRPPHRARLSAESLTRVWRFAAGMFGIGMLSLALTQADKILLSKLLTLEQYGYYTFATTAALSISFFTMPVGQAVYPRMTELHAQRNELEMIDLFHKAAQLIAVASIPLALMVGCFAEEVILVWSGDASIGALVAPILAPLALGTWLNSLMGVPYHAQLAHGWTALSLYCNLIAASLLIPLLFVVVPVFGAVGAAWLWVCLNVGYFTIATYFMHRRIFPSEKWRWYLRDIGLPLAAGLCLVALLKLMEPDFGGSRFGLVTFLFMSYAMLTLVVTSACDKVRPLAVGILRDGVNYLSRRLS